MASGRTISRYLFSALLPLAVTVLNVSCTKDDGPSDPIQPSDEGAVDPNATALPPEFGDPVDPATAPGDVQGDMDDGASADGTSTADDAVDAPLGTLTDDPWAAPGEPADLKDGSGSIVGEDLSSGSEADTAGIPSMGSDSLTDPLADPTYDAGTSGSTNSLGYSPATKKPAAPKAAARKKSAKAKKSKSKSAAAMAAGSGGESFGSGSSVRYVTAIQLNVRSAPNRRASMVRRIKGGDKVNVTMTGSWAKLGEGEYVRTKFLSKKPQRVVSEEEIEAAWTKRNKKKVKSKAVKAPKKKAAKAKAKAKAKINTQPEAELPGDTGLPPDPSTPVVETPDDQLHGDQEP